MLPASYLAIQYGVSASRWQMPARRALVHRTETHHRDCAASAALDLALGGATRWFVQQEGLVRSALFAATAAAFVLSIATGSRRAHRAGWHGGESRYRSVAQGCGVVWHRGPFGGCRRNLSPAWPCWWVRGPFGRWRLVCCH